MVALLLGGHSTGSCATGSCPTLAFSPVTFLTTLAVVAAYLVIAYLGATRAALAFSHARPTGPGQAQVVALLEGLSLAAGVRPPKLYVIDDPAPNAFATGTRPANTAVRVTTGLLDRLSSRELEGGSRASGRRWPTQPRWS